MALENYMRPERLEADNQYQCSQCERRVDAVKGLKIKTLPKILTVQMNRFTLDWTTFQMVKVHDKVTFPYVLNGNNYLRGFEGIKDKHTEKAKEKEQKDREAIKNRPPVKPSLAFNVDLSN
jgi:ubiquitin carboxyl-terminal hydrolase 47